MFHGSIAKEDKRRAAELDHDMSVARRHPLARTKIEGNVGPAPVVNQQLHGDEGLGARIRRHVGFGPVSWNLFSVHGSFSVLPAYRAAEKFLIVDRLDGMQNLGLFVAHSIGVK